MKPLNPVVFRQSMIGLKEQIRQANTQNGRDSVYSRRFRQKRRLFAIQRGRCCFCNIRMYACSEVYSPGTAHRCATREHVIPKSKRKSIRDMSNVCNIALSCHRCNKIRGVIEFSIFKKIAEFAKFEDIPILVRKARGHSSIEQVFDRYLKTEMING